jgi:hypothetical protein
VQGFEQANRAGRQYAPMSLHRFRTLLNDPAKPTCGRSAELNTRNFNRLRDFCGEVVFPANMALVGLASSICVIVL